MVIYIESGYLEVNDELIDWRYHKVEHMRRHRTRNRTIDRQETLELLANDKKFMAALDEYGRKFRKGYDTLITLRSKKR